MNFCNNEPFCYAETAKLEYLFLQIMQSSAEVPKYLNNEKFLYFYAFAIIFGYVALDC